MKELFFSDVETTIRILVTAPILYFLVILYIRIVGKRSTSQMNNFDWIVTVAIGSLVGSTIIVNDISIWDGALAILILLALQYLITKFMLDSAILRKMVRSTPRILLYNGELIKENMDRERILEPEIMAAIRENGFKSKEQVHAVVLENDAKLSVIPHDKTDTKSSSLMEVSGLPDELKDTLEQQEKEM